MGSALLSFENKSADSDRSRMILYRGALLTFHADSTDTSGQFALMEAEGASGSEPPPHVHRNEDEMFYLLEGELKVMRGTEEITLCPGQSVFLPRGVMHAFKVVSRAARMLVYITPGGFEEFFRELGQPVSSNDPSPMVSEPAPISEVIRVAGRYGLTFMP